MISILLFYCPSRRQLFESTWDILGRYESVKNSEKILCCDGEPDIHPTGFEVLNIPRRDGHYCWANVFNAGAQASHHETLLYLDCDRCFPESYLEVALSLITNKSVVSPSYTYRCSRELLSQALEGPPKGVLEPRVSHPPDVTQSQIGKNPFSGNVMITRSLYYSIGGFDDNFLGYGYADLDLYNRAYNFGAQFKFVSVPEYHLEHVNEYNDYYYSLMCAYNCLIFCKKHGVEPIGMDRLFSKYMITPKEVLSYHTLDAFLKSRYMPFL